LTGSGRELIDAHRNLDDNEIFAQGRADSPETLFQRIHRQMAEHRQSCAIYRWYGDYVILNRNRYLAQVCWELLREAHLTQEGGKARIGTERIYKRIEE